MRNRQATPLGLTSPCGWGDDACPTSCRSTVGSTEPAVDALSPLLLSPDLRLSPEQFALVCQANPEAVLELTVSGQLIALTPTSGDTGARNHVLGWQSPINKLPPWT